ncbi:MAG: alkaline phosphatase, partial [Verrucomicrobiaceae bacterium]
AGRALAAEPVSGAAAVFSGYPFTLGVASGDPSADGFVLWTRLAPKPMEGGGMKEESVWVDWQVAEDEGMSRIVASGREAAHADWAHSVHVEVANLKPDRWYWYQFKAGGEASPKARTRTLASPDQAADQTSTLRMAFASCQHWEAGHYTAYEHMLRENPDVVIHLGDYIYEGRGREGQLRRHVGDEPMDLVSYRNRHAQYKTDPALQAMHQAAPWIVTWDDHEVENNYAGPIPEEKAHSTPEAFLRRRAAAYQAYYEHMPLRAACVPKGPDMKLYRTVRHGRLVDFHVLDTRQYRTDQPYGGERAFPGPEVMNPDGTLLGKTQREWLYSQMKTSPATWNVLAQQVMMARVDRAAGPDVACAMDQWPAYEVERRAVLRAFQELKVSNPVVITGDIHTHWANDLLTDFDNLESRTVASELVCSSISSKGDGEAKPKFQDSMLRENPFVKYFSDRRGYVSCTIGPKIWRTDFRTVDYVSRPGAPLVTPVSYILESGRAGLQNA